MDPFQTNSMSSYLYVNCLLTSICQILRANMACEIHGQIILLNSTDASANFAVHRFIFRQAIISNSDSNDCLS